MGVGVTSFGLIRMPDVRDPSIKEVRARVDFFVTRADNTAARLHPHKSGRLHEAQVILGDLKDWREVRGERLAEPPRPRAHAPSSHAGDVAEALAVNDELCREVAQIDRIPHLVAGTCLLEMANSAGLEYGQRCEVPRFKWWRLLANIRAEARATIFGGVAVSHFGVERSPEPEGHSFVGKYDGYRFVATRTDGGRVHIWPRGADGVPRKTKVVVVVQ